MTRSCYSARDRGRRPLAVVEQVGVSIEVPSSAQPTAPTAGGGSTLPLTGVAIAAAVLWAVLLICLGVLLQRMALVAGRSKGLR